MENGIVILGMLLVVVLVGAARRKTEWIINFVLRMVLGTILIYFANSVLHRYGVDVSVGINGISVLTTGFLGIPGLLALYGICFL